MEHYSRESENDRGGEQNIEDCNIAIHAWHAPSPSCSRHGSTIRGCRKNKSPASRSEGTPHHPIASFQWTHLSRSFANRASSFIDSPLCIRRNTTAWQRAQSGWPAILRGSSSSLPQTSQSSVTETDMPSRKIPKMKENPPVSI